MFHFQLKIVLWMVSLLEVTHRYSNLSYNDIILSYFIYIILYDWVINTMVEFLGIYKKLPTWIKFTPHCIKLSWSDIKATLKYSIFIASYTYKLLPFLFRSVQISLPSSRFQEIFGCGKPVALQNNVRFWFSRTATDDRVLSSSTIFGGTE